MCVKMMAGLFGNVFCLLPLYVHVLTADTDPVLRVKTMNSIFTHPGWTDSAVIKVVGIVVQRTGTGETQIMNIDDILATDSNHPIVTEHNVDNKIRQAYQFLSCRYVHVIRMCYEYGLGAANRCATIVDESQWRQCVNILWQMVGEIDELMSRLRGMFWCLYKLSPSKQLDENVAYIVKNFKLYYDRLTLDRENRNAIIKRTTRLMAFALRSLSEFFDRFCILFPLEPINDGIPIAAEIVQPSDGSTPSNAPNPPNPANATIDEVKKIQADLNLFVQVHVIDYDTKSLGFKYDPRQNTTSVVNEPYES